MGFTSHEKNSVCSAAAAATLATVVAMIAWSSAAGELDDFSARKASDLFLAGSSLRTSTRPTLSR